MLNKNGLPSEDFLPQYHPHKFQQLHVIFFQMPYFHSSPSSWEIVSRAERSP